MVGSPTSPVFSQNTRPMSAVIRPARSSSRMSMSSRTGGGSRASDEDGRTSVKVAVRVRPPLRATDPGFDLIPQRFQKGMVNVTSPTSLAVDSPQGRKIFVFDRVFGEDVDQDGIWQYLEESVSAFVQGYNVSLLAYGQSGAGKSYTMGTSSPSEQTDPKVMGVIPRAAMALFEKLSAGASNNHSRNSSTGIRAPSRYSTPVSVLQQMNIDKKNWTMKASYVEIYNEQLRDLLLPEGTRSEERAPISIREDTKGRIILTGLHQVTINSVDDLLEVLNFGSSIRQTDATAINAKSSRSHAVFSLNLVQRKPKGPGVAGQKEDNKRFSVPTEMMGQDGYITVDSKMHFVDLAGSERLKNTHAQGERAKEGISINAGLASLGKVISQLSSRNAGSHVSYRDSKLTRLLQDSLGGNAITYMIACVTPAEFHLSETLNTIQYAQRARAIQSKPKIQQISDDSDMRALVERLRAEIAFLREQIKNNSESRDRETKGDKNRPERSNEKERELQNQLLDLKENYGALSQRHAKLISEIARARESEEAAAPATEYTDSAVERLKRSNSFAEAVEQVVLEYEKTIESLESSLSITRSSLSNTESSLLEKETKLVYIENLNQQLHTRLQRLMDRESSTESYLHDLETKLDSHTTGEEKNAAIIAELRKEIARVRENEASCEDYISTLEERLAEADQDLELMTREIARLEHVVERQRSLGKLDNLLYELDSLKEQDSNKSKGDTELEAENPIDQANGWASDEEVKSHRESKKAEKIEFSAETIKEEDEDATVDAKKEEERSNSSLSRNYLPPSITLGDPSDLKILEYPPQSPAQSQFVADKLESVQQELFDLKVEHEATLHEYDHMSANYEAALRDLALLQDQLDEYRHSKGSSTQSASPPPSPSPRPTSFLADARVGGLKDTEERSSSSRSLSLELSLAGDSPVSCVTTNSEATSHFSEVLDVQRIQSKEKEEALSKELERLKREKEEKEEEHSRLHLQLRHSLDKLADLKTCHRASGVMSSSSSQVLRRKSSQSLAMLDRAQRTFANLRRIAMEHLENRPEVLENFELNIDDALRELVTRSDRIMELESDVHGLRKEMESKQAIITGLTRERSSISATPMDISVVAVMERRIEESEAELVKTKEILAEREAELEAATKVLEERSGESQSDAASLLMELTKERSLNAKQSKKIAELQGELQHVKTSHDITLDSLKQSKDALSKTLIELEAEFSKSKHDILDERAMIEAAEETKIKHQERVEALQNIISDNRATIDAQLSRVAELERTHAVTQEQIDIKLASADSSEAAIKKHQAISAELEQTIAENRQTIESQQARLSVLEESYKDALSQLSKLRDKEAAAIEALKKVEARSLVGGAVGAQEADQSDITKLQASYAEATALIEKLEKEKSMGVSESERIAALEKEIAESKEDIERNLETIKQLQESHAELQEEIQILVTREEKHAKMIESMEQQLTFGFDENQETKSQLNKLMEDYERLQRERETLVAESTEKDTKAQELIDSLNDEITTLKTKLAEKEMELQEAGAGRTQRSNSTSSANLRKSASSASLPSPPPAIPLPPLPGTGNVPAQTPASPNASRRPSKDYAHAQEKIEDQEAKIKTLEKQLQAEKALTATLEEALTDCEKTMKRLTTDRDSFQAKASQVQQELDRAKTESQTSRYSMQAVEEERLGRLKAEQAREQLEQRMQALAKKKRSFACF
ncbi:hypothetical protein RUND412_001439 [Rhizina undulata]